MGRAPRQLFPLLALASWHLAEAPRALAARDVPTSVEVATPVPATPAEPVPSTDTAESHEVRAELGLEVDSNPQRAESTRGVSGVVATPSPLARAVVSWATQSNLGAHHQLTFNLALAGKRFLRDAAQTEDVLLVDEAARWSWRVSPRAATGLSASYDEALQRHLTDFRDRPAAAPLPEPRDYRAAAGQARLAVFPATGWTLLAGAGARWFFYKPFPDNGFWAPTGGLALRFQHEADDPEGEGADWELNAGADLEARRFAGLRRVACSDQTICVSREDPGASQRDTFVQARAELTRTGFLLLGLGYVFQVNDSNSYQWSVVRHLVSARMATRLPLGLYLAARGELVFASYRDPMNLAWDNAGKPYATFEDENRSNARLELTRSLPGGFELVLRGSYYAGAIGSAGDYRRQTLMLVTAWTWN